MDTSAPKIKKDATAKAADMESQLLKLKAKNLKLERALVASQRKLMKLEKENLRLRKDAESSKLALGIIRATQRLPDEPPIPFDEEPKA